MSYPQDLKLAVYGPGLLGGSLLLDAGRLGIRDVRAWARREESVEAIRRRGLATLATTDPREAAEGADLIILTVPVGAMEPLVREILQAKTAPGAVITDVGSVKAMVLQGVGARCREAGVAFVGSHPMAGSETVGLEAARPGLFDGAVCIVTPEEDTPTAALEAVERFWITLGCRVSRMEAVYHDGVVARISHMPHAAAAAVTLAAMGPDPSIASFAAGGLRDTTRVASGDAGMWREILLENRAAVLPALEDLHRLTGDLLEMLRDADEGKLLRFLAEARRLRATRYS